MFKKKMKLENLRSEKWRMSRKLLLFWCKRRKACQGTQCQSLRKTTYSIYMLVNTERQRNTMDLSVGEAWDVFEQVTFRFRRKQAESSGIYRETWRVVLLTDQCLRPEAHKIFLQIKWEIKNLHMCISVEYVCRRSMTRGRIVPVYL